MFVNLPSPQKGFTLIELMVTLFIISTLLTIGATSYRNLIKNARDTQRQSDIKVIQSALEQYRADQGFYPQGSNNSLGSSLSYPAGCSSSSSTCRVYLNRVPNDPLNSANANYQYKYQEEPANSCTNDSTNPATYCNRYCLYAQVENDTNANSTDVAECSDKVGTPAYNYKATPP